MKFIEKYPRHLVKMVTWRLIVNVSNFLTGWIVSGDWHKGLETAGILLVVNSTLYFLHERGWNKSSWARAIK